MPYALTEQGKKKAGIEWRQQEIIKQPRNDGAHSVNEGLPGEFLERVQSGLFAAIKVGKSWTVPFRIEPCALFTPMGCNSNSPG